MGNGVSNLPRYESWPPAPAAPAPYVPSQTPAYGYGAPSWHQPIYQPTPVLTRQRSNVAPVVLAIVATPVALVLLVALVSGLFVFAPLAAVAVPAGAVMLAVARPRRAGAQNRRPADNRPAPTRRPSNKTAPPLSNYRYKKG